MGDLLGNIRFVKLTTVHSLALAEAIREVLQKNQVASVIINDEQLQGLPDDQRNQAMAEGEPFRIEVPESIVQKARGILNDFFDQLEQGGA